MKRISLEGWELNEKGTLIKDSVFISRFKCKDYSLQTVTKYKVQDYSGKIKTQMFSSVFEAMVYVQNNS
ncbi:hypothetical protein nACB2_117 [Acinetobacter phage nACB2]|nr:hypothetical protein nACB2_117 [Acinetobacter phage nACB2]